MLQNRSNIVHRAYYDTKPYPCQYGIVFDDNDTETHNKTMKGMREILKELMAKNGDNAYTLSDRSGVPQPTIQRFLSGLHGDPRSETVRKLARAYGLTESQLRGDATVGMQPDKPKISDENFRVRRIVNSIDKDALEAWIKIGTLLCKSSPKVRRSITERGMTAGKLIKNHDHQKRSEKE